MEKKMFVVLSIVENPCCGTTSEVVGLCSTKEKAVNAMREEFEIIKNNFNGDEEDVEIETFEDSMEYYNHVTDDYAKVRIVEKEVE